MKLDHYICCKCKRHFDSSEVETKRDRETGCVYWYCPFCGADDDSIYDAEQCEYCGEWYDKDDEMVYDDEGGAGVCLKCIGNKFDYDEGFEHIKKCKYCASEFTNLLTNYHPDIEPTEQTVFLVINYADIVRTRTKAEPTEEPSGFAKLIECCIKDACLGTDIDHYLHASKLIDRL